MINVMVNGAFGKMGTMTVDTLKNHPDFNVVATLGRNDDLSLQLKNTSAHLVIDFTHAEVAYQNACTIIDAGLHPVIGSTGFLREQVATLKDLCAQKKLGGIIASNFSMGAVLMMKYASDAARYFQGCEIIEMHHPHKLDAPSGTALKTSELIREHLKADPTSSSLREMLPGARGANDRSLHIHSVRLPGILADQHVIFGNLGETLTLQHHTLTRECFMPGLIYACQKILHLDYLVDGLEALL